MQKSAHRFLAFVWPSLFGEYRYDFDLPLNRTDPIVILHFNDVYNIDSREDGSGGVARFVTAMQRFSHLHPLVFFSGKCSGTTSCGDALWRAALQIPHRRGPDILCIAINSSF